MSYAIAIPERTAGEFRKSFPGVPFASFAAILSSYAIAKAEPEPTFSAIRDELDEVAKRAWEFASYLRRIGLEAGDHIAAQAALRGFGGGMLDQLVRQADGFGGCAEMARRTVEGAVVDGRREVPETRLIRALARLLAEQGKEINARPQGPVCLAFGLAVDVAISGGLLEERPKDLRGTVANALKGWDKE